MYNTKSKQDEFPVSGFQLVCFYYFRILYLKVYSAACCHRLASMRERLEIAKLKMK